MARDSVRLAISSRGTPSFSLHYIVNIVLFMICMPRCFICWDALQNPSLNSGEKTVGLADQSDFVRAETRWQRILPPREPTRATNNKDRDSRLGKINIGADMCRASDPTIAPPGSCRAVWDIK